VEEDDDDGSSIDDGGIDNDCKDEKDKVEFSSNFLLSEGKELE
jgi:hypothetical protein